MKFFIRDISHSYYWNNSHLLKFDYIKISICTVIFLHSHASCNLYCQSNTIVKSYIFHYQCQYHQIWDFVFVINCLKFSILLFIVWELFILNLITAFSLPPHATFAMPLLKETDDYKSCWIVDFVHCDGASVFAFQNHKGVLELGILWLCWSQLELNSAGVLLFLRFLFKWYFATECPT